MAYSVNESVNADYLIILGCRVKGSEAQQTLIMRIEAAAEYLSEHKNTVAIACGGIVHSDQLVSEAEVIKQGLINLGVESQRIILDDKSKTTIENFVNAREIIKNLEKERDRKAVLAFLSSDFHIERALLIAKQCGLDVYSVASASPSHLLKKNTLREKAILLYLKRSQTHPHS